MKELNAEGMAVAPGVVETIVSIAVGEVEGVAVVGASGVGGIRSVLSSKQSVQGIEIVADEAGQLNISVRIEVFYGHVLPEVAAAVRTAVADAVAGQVGLSVANVDVYIDGVQFAN